MLASVIGSWQLAPGSSRPVSLHSTYFGSPGIAALLRAQGESIELTPKNGNALSMTALVASEEGRIVGDGQGKRTIRARRFTITKDPDSPFGGHADPQENARVTYALTDYAVVSRQDCGTHWELLCDFTARAERTRPALRTHA